MQITGFPTPSLLLTHIDNKYNRCSVLFSNGQLAWRSLTLVAALFLVLTDSTCSRVSFIQIDTMFWKLHQLFEPADEYSKAFGHVRQNFHSQ